MNDTTSAERLAIEAATELGRWLKACFELDLFSPDDGKITGEITESFLRAITTALEQRDAHMAALQNEVIRLTGLLRISNTERNDAQQRLQQRDADTQRLDWLEENWMGATQTLVFGEDGTPLRAAIDAAMSPAGPATPQPLGKPSCCECGGEDGDHLGTCSVHEPAVPSPAHETRKWTLFAYPDGGISLPSECAAQKYWSEHGGRLITVVEAHEAREGETEIQKKLRQLSHGPRTLDAKWLDPECWDRCQSLVYKKQLSLAREALEKAVALRKFIIENPHPTFDVPDETWVPFTVSLDAALAQLNTVEEEK